MINAKFEPLPETALQPEPPSSFTIHDPDAYAAAGSPNVVVLAGYVRQKLGEVTLANDHTRVLQYQDAPLPVDIPQAA